MSSYTYDQALSHAIHLLGTYGPRLQTSMLVIFLPVLASWIEKLPHQQRQDALSSLASGIDSWVDRNRPATEEFEGPARALLEYLENLVNVDSNE